MDVSQRGLAAAWSAVHDVLAGLLSIACTLLDDEPAWIRERLQDALVWVSQFDPKDRIYITYISKYIYTHHNAFANIRPMTTPPTPPSPSLYMQAVQSMDGLRYLCDLYVWLWPLHGGAVCSNLEAASLLRFLLRYWRDMVVNACVQCMATWDRVEFLNLLEAASGGVIGEPGKRGEELVALLLQSLRRLYGDIPSSEPTREQKRIRRNRQRRRERKLQRLFAYHAQMMQHHWECYMYHAQLLEHLRPGMPGSSTDAVQPAPSEATELDTIADAFAFTDSDDDDDED